MEVLTTVGFVCVWRFVVFVTDGRSKLSFKFWDRTSGVRNIYKQLVVHLWCPLVKDYSKEYLKKMVKRKEIWGHCGHSWKLNLDRSCSSMFFSPISVYHCVSRKIKIKCQGRRRLERKGMIFELIFEISDRHQARSPRVRLNCLGLHPTFSEENGFEDSGRFSNINQSSSQHCWFMPINRATLFKLQQKNREC